MKQSGVARQTIHYYVRIGLLPRPTRTSRTYALYPRDTVELLKAIKECQELLRLSLDEIGKLLRKAHHEVRRVRSELEDLKKGIPVKARGAEGRPQFLTADQVVAGLHPSPPEGWLAELRRCELIQGLENRFSTDSIRLIHSIWKLCQLGVQLEDLRQLSQKIEREAEAEVALFRSALHQENVVRGDYPVALRMLDALDQFAQGTRKEWLRTAFNAQTHKPTHLFVGPNQKHVLPSETMLSEMGLNREIDRLLHGLDRRPDNRKALADLGHAYYLRSDWFNLAGVSSKLLQLDSGNVRAIADLSRSLIYLGDVEQAIQLLERRLKVESDPLLRFRLGQAILLQAREAGVAELLIAVRRKQQLTSEALSEARTLPGIRRWIMLDHALDHLSVSDPLQLSQPTFEQLEELNREYQELPDRGRSVLGRISLVMGRMFALYALYLVCRRDRNPKADELLRTIVRMDPYTVLSTRLTSRTLKVENDPSAGVGKTLS